MPIIYRRRTVKANAVDLLRSRISDLKRSCDVMDMREVNRELRDAIGPDERDAVLRTYFDGAEIAALEWVIREIFEDVP